MERSTDYIIKLFKHSPDAVTPSKAHGFGVYDDAAFDLFTPYAVTISPGERLVVDTLLSLLIPEDYWVKLHERSGLAANKGIRLGAGVIDPGYTGTVKVVLHNTSQETHTLAARSAIAQATLEKIRPTAFVELTSEAFEYEQEKRSRKGRGFGSSDVQV